MPEDQGQPPEPPPDPANEVDEDDTYGDEVLFQLAEMEQEYDALKKRLTRRQ
jgi:hypothetical protein